MTTIAYRAGVIAADTLCTRHDQRYGRVTKIHKRGPLLAGASGSTVYCQKFRDWFLSGCEGRRPVMKSDDGEVWAEGFIVMPDDLIISFGPDYGGEWATRTWHGFYAMGSGKDFASGAMAAGATAEEAVQCAIQFDTCSGGEVQVLKR